MNFSFDHILKKPWMNDCISGLKITEPFFTSAARSIDIVDRTNLNLINGAVSINKDWTKTIGTTSCIERIAGSNTYLNQPVVNSIYATHFPKAFVPIPVNGFCSDLTNEQQIGNSGINHLKLNNEALIGFTARSAALLNNNIVIPNATFSGTPSAAEIFMNDFVSLSPKTSEFPVSCGIWAQNGAIHMNSSLHSNNSIALNKYGATGVLMKDTFSANAKFRLDHSYLNCMSGITDPITSKIATSEFYSQSNAASNNRYAQKIYSSGATDTANSLKINSLHDLNGAPILVTANKGFVNAIGARGVVFDNQEWKVNAQKNLYPRSVCLMTESVYLTSLGLGSVYKNHLQNTDFGISALPKATTTQWHSTMIFSPGVNSALSVNGLLNSNTLCIDNSIKALSNSLGVTGIYGSTVRADISSDPYKIFTGEDAIWKKGLLFCDSKAFSTNSVGIYHDYLYRSGSQEVLLPSYSEPTISEKVVIKYTLKSRLSVLNASLADSYQGAAEALNNRRADHIRQACISMRQLLDFFVNELFTINEFRQWSGYSEDLLRLNWKQEVIGVQRKAAYQFVTRKLQSAPEPKRFIELMEKCNGGCHRFDGNYSLNETVTLFHKCEAMLEVLLNATDAASN